jgi:putative peptide zinc metalloprotease protein
MAHEERPDNAAVAINEEDGSTVLDLAFDIVKVGGEIVDQTNLALAYSNCENCRTIAIAVQVVLVMGDPEVVTPENVALAINDECLACTTVALAYQFVIGHDGLPIKLSPEGKRELKAIDEALEELLESELPAAELAAAVDVLMEEVRTILDEEIEFKHDQGDRDDEGDDDRDDDRDDEDDDEGEDTEGEDDGAAGTEPTPAPAEASAEPSPSAEPSEDPSPTPSDSGSATAEPSPEPSASSDGG